MLMSNDNIDWNELSSSDQAKAEGLLQELNELFNKNIQQIQVEDKPCEDSTLGD